MDVVETPDGKWQGIGVTRFEAHQPGWKKKWRNTFPDGKLVMRARNGDLLKLSDKDGDKVYRIASIEAAADRFWVAEHSEAGDLTARYKYGVALRKLIKLRKEKSAISDLDDRSDNPEFWSLEKLESENAQNFTWKLPSIASLKAAKARLVRITPDGQLIDLGPPA
jgi:hypothetical protein